MGSVLSFYKALEQGCEPREYCYDPVIIPTGTFDAILEFKIWGKKTASVVCYFTQKETGAKFYLSVLKRIGDGKYMLDGCAIDFRECPAPALYQIQVDKNTKGNPVLKNAVLVKN